MPTGSVLEEVLREIGLNRYVRAAGVDRRSDIILNRNEFSC